MAKNSSVGYESYCSCVITFRKQLPHRFSARGIDKIRRDIGKWHEHKSPQRKSGMGNGQARLLNNLISEKQNVDIQCTGALDLIPGAVLSLLYFMADRQQFVRRQVCVCLQNGIEKPGLVENLSRFC